MDSPYKNFQFKDIPALEETFADGVHFIAMDGGNAKILLTVVRPDKPEPPKGKVQTLRITGHKVPVARLVMTGNSFFELYNEMHKLVMGLEQQGLITREGAEVKKTLQ